jgi:sigma-70-like protein
MWGIFNGVTGYVGPAVLGAPSDAGLARAAQQGDAASLGALLDRYRASLYACGLACLRRPEDAADAVQETFLLALTRLSQVRDPEAVGGWLHAVMRSVRPPDDPRHCPPGVTRVLFHDGTDQVRCSLGYFHGGPVQGPA